VNDTVERIRAVLAAIQTGGNYPQWFMDLERQYPKGGWISIFKEAITTIERVDTDAAELEQLRNSYGRLLRQLYPE
jgi:hypothetical protein